MAEKRLQIRCSDSCEMFEMYVSVAWDNDVKVLLLGTYIDAFLAAQDSWWARFTRRMSWAWAILRGKDHWVQEIVITDAGDVGILATWLEGVAGEMAAPVEQPPTKEGD